MVYGSVTNLLNSSMDEPISQANVWCIRFVGLSYRFKNAVRSGVRSDCQGHSYTLLAIAWFPGCKSGVTTTELMCNHMSACMVLVMLY